MDEIEFKQTYNEACKATERIAAPETKSAIMHMLLLINSLNESVVEILESLEDDC